jgi:hypothetical protein
VASLSVACVSRDATGRLAAVLRLYREVADQIVVALDDRVLDDALAALGDAADRVFAIPFRPPVERTLGWLHSVCDGEWVFRTDDDEVPSKALLDELTTLRGERGLTHAFVPRRWLWGGADTYLDGPPWRPDYQLRALRNDPAIAWFPGITHWPTAAVGEHRYLSGPLYHLDLLATTREQREEKARLYERAEPGRRIVGLPLNRAYYVPELRFDVTLASLPPADAGAVRTLLEPRQASARRVNAEPIGAGEIDACWDGARPNDTDYRAELSLAEAVAPFRVGEVRGVDVRVRNLGERTWPPGGLGRFPVALSYRWDGVGDGLRTVLPARLPPRHEQLVPVSVAAPDAPGLHRLSIDLLEEQVTWFGCTIDVDVDIRAAARVIIAGEDDELTRLAAARLVESRPELEPILFAQDPGAVSARLGYAAAESAHVHVLRPSALATVRRAARLAIRPSDEPFVDALQGARALLVVGIPPSRRERLVELVLRLIAGRYRVPVTAARTAEDLDSAIAALPVSGP